MDPEMKSFIKIWITAITSLIYCYYVSSRIPKGIKRLISILPILYFFIVLPLELKSFHLGGPTAFFLVWLAISKLVLFSFHKPPLSPLQSPFLFVSLALLPIKIASGDAPASHVARIPTLFKLALLALIVKAYEYRPYLSSYVTLLLYCSHMYLGIELILALCAIPARAAFGFRLEPQFNEPYRTTSLQDFWGRRWNLMVSKVLKPTAYEPARVLTGLLLGPFWARLAGIVWAFTVSGLMHEVIYYYLTRVGPTGEVTGFFVIQGVAVAAEVAVKKWVGVRWRVPGAVSGFLALGFLVVSGDWLFFPQLMRNCVHEKAISEYVIMVDFVRSVMSMEKASQSTVYIFFFFRLSQLMLGENSYVSRAS